MKIFGRVIIILLILGTLVGTLYYLYSKNQEKPFEYTTLSPEVKDVIKKTVATGKVLPRKEILIKPQVSGIIQEIYVEAGQMVKKGQLIAKIKIIPDMLNLNNAESRVNRAKMALENANTDYKRNKKLLEQAVIAQADFQPFQLALTQAEEELDAAENNLQLIKEGSSKKMGESSNTLIRSTVDGMVIDIPVEEGNQVIESNTFNEGTTIAAIANMNEMIFEGKVDESEVGKIKEGMRLLLSIGAIENKTFDAVLEYIAPKGVEENGAIQFEIRADVKLDSSVFIRAGYSATADIVLDRKNEVLTIPESVLLFEDGKTFVEVETSNQVFEKREISTGLSDGINIEIIQGLDINSKIKSGKKELENYK